MKTASFQSVRWPADRCTHMLCIGKSSVRETNQALEELGTPEGRLLDCEAVELDGASLAHHIRTCALVREEDYHDIDQLHVQQLRQ